MATRRGILAGGIAALSASVLTAARGRAAGAAEVALSEAEWRRRLTAGQYAVLRESGTERPYSSPLLKEHRKGVFSCAGCSQPAFSSDTKFESNTGWPSFWAALDGAVATETDTSFGTVRTAVNCRRCGGHLGHVFRDGPRPTGLRYCMNGVALGFRPGAA